ncbi:YrbL family protein [Parahaliea mediterranea]|uniref:YrbL family protein n=1 Tax=Parahaliea mediterranea TaxID=651086 RepID=UPI00130064F7|nr:YrbL family protein [Parahaliea mediterranea]
MLHLDDDLLIGRGLHRACYRHPRDPALCIKVVHNGDQTESQREQAYYRHLQGRLTDWSLLPRFHGVCTTDRGPGAVFDRVRDADGSTSVSLEACLTTPATLDRYRQALPAALAQLRAYLLRHGVLTMTIKPRNIALQRSDNGSALRCVIFDNIGCADWIPLALYSRRFARRKILRRWQRFEARLLAEHPEAFRPAQDNSRSPRHTPAPLFHLPARKAAAKDTTTDAARAPSTRPGAVPSRRS